MLPQQTYQTLHSDYLAQIKYKSDRLINYFLGSFFVCGLLLALFYDTWLVALGVGGLSLLAEKPLLLTLTSGIPCLNPTTT